MECKMVKLLGLVFLMRCYFSEPGVQGPLRPPVGCRGNALLGLVGNASGKLLRCEEKKTFSAARNVRYMENVLWHMDMQLCISMKHLDIIMDIMDIGRHYTKSIKEWGSPATLTAPSVVRSDPRIMNLHSELVLHFNQVILRLTEINRSED